MRMMIQVCSIVFPVALLFYFSGCSGKKKARVPQNNLSQINLSDGKTSSHVSLIVPTQKKVVREGQKQENCGLENSAFDKKEDQLLGSAERLICLEAKVGEVPVPLMAQLIDAADNGKGGYRMVYETLLSFQDLTSFYSQEISQLGWTLVTMFQTDEVFYSFRKNGQLCIILIRPISRWWGTIKYQLHVYVQA